MLKSYMEDTKSQYHQIINKSRKIFVDKNSDYGSSWRVLRIISLVDQINIKAQRIRNLQNNINNKSTEVTLKANEYLEEMKKMILDYPKSVILKVNENLTNDRDYYSRIENRKKENVDELTIANIISCSMIMLAIQ